MTRRTLHTGAAPVTLSYEADLCGNIEQALKGLQGYGIMALELIQNADDARAGFLSFNVRDDGLVVRNDASFSTCGLAAARCPWERVGGPDGLRRPCNFHAISRMGGRSKIHAAEQIGRFGIGFVSVYQITDTPIVRSAGTELLLNPLTGEAKQKPIAVADGTEFVLPWASANSDIREALNASLTPYRVADKLVEEVGSVLRSSLLFLRHLRRIEVRRNGSLQFAVDVDRSDAEVTMVFAPDSRTERWIVLSRSGSDIVAQRKLLAKYETLEKLGRSPIVSVAIPSQGDRVEGLLYAYLPTRQSTHMPIHINGDFFPHSSRQEIVLRGEGHERFWNEALIATAAAIIGENFEKLRDLLGFKRLWELGEAAFQIRDAGCLSEFWSRFSHVAKTSSSVWTSVGEWRTPTEVCMPRERMQDAEQAAVSSIGVRLLHPCLSTHWTALSAVGVTELRLDTITASLEALNGVGLVVDNSHLKPLWSAIAKLIDVSRTRPGFDAAISRLKEATFLIDVDGDAASPSQVWRTPETVPPAMVHRYIPGCPIVHSDVLQCAQISELIDEYDLIQFARDIATNVKDLASAESWIGTEPDQIRDFYKLLTSFPFTKAKSQVRSILANTPFLRTADSFVTPSRGKLPGDFRDPVGHVELLDLSLFTPHMEQFSGEVLGVSMLSFRDYIEKHLEGILAESPTPAQYRSLITEIANHKSQLDDDAGLELLAKRSFVRTRSGSYVRPEQCYYWTAELEALLGDNQSWWVDESWMPTGKLGSRLRDLFEGRLRMPTTVSAKHIVRRIKEAIEHGTQEEAIKATTPIIRYVISRWARFTDKEIDELGQLRTVKFLPAIISGERVTSTLFLPGEVYRAVRANGFASQVPVVDLAPLRQTGAVVNELLDLLKMPTEPPTGVVVAHMLHCMKNDLPASDVTYAILNERLERSDDLAAIYRLADTAFIYDAESKSYLKADQVFWGTTPFVKYWRSANSSMRRREALYRRLGVQDQPRPINYAALMLEIARNQDATDSDRAVHFNCLGCLAEALDRDDEGVQEAIEALAGERSLLNLDGEPIWTDDAVWLDSEHLSSAFGTALNERLVKQPDVHRIAAARLFRCLSVQPISEVASLRLAVQPESIPAPEATERLRERRDLILWLAPNRSSRAELRRILNKVDIRLARTLRIQAEIAAFDPPVHSPSRTVLAFYDRDTAVLYVGGSAVSSSEWTAAFRALFSEIERYCSSADIPPLVMTASFVILLDTWEEAENALRQSDYVPADDDAEDVPYGNELGEVADEYQEANEEFEGDQQASKQQATGSRRALGQDGTDEDICGLKEGEDLGTKPNPNRAKRADLGYSAGGPANSPATAGTSAEADCTLKRDGGAFGTNATVASDLSTEADRGNNSRENGTPTSNKGPAGKRGETRSEQQTRRSRMLAYVSKASARGSDDSAQGRHSDDTASLIDVAAIKAVLNYEEKRGWRPEEQPHGNPGYDIISRSADGRRRLIEVKGLESEWTARGIKLSHVQYRMAENHPEEFWIYVVEHARDLERQLVSAISNPFEQVQEYWFDHNWRGAAEEMASGRDVNLRIGAKIKHETWGVGTIIAIKSSGSAPFLTIDFGFIGRRGVPYKSSLKIVD